MIYGLQCAKLNAAWQRALLDSGYNVELTLQVSKVEMLGSKGAMTQHATEKTDM